MKVNQVIETPDGGVQVNAEFSPEQTKFIIEVGLGVLLAQGANFLDDGYQAHELMQTEGVMQ